MSRKFFATAGIIVTAFGASLFAAPAATAATPKPSSFVDCISCWTPQRVDAVAISIGSKVGSALLGTRVG